MCLCVAALCETGGIILLKRISEGDDDDREKTSAWNSGVSETQGK